MARLRAARITRAVACGVLLGVGGCRGGDATEPITNNTLGAIRVVVSISGVDLPSRYSVYADGRSAVPDKDGVALLPRITPGSRPVTLIVPGNCHIDGDNPKPADVVVGQTTAVSFSVTCESTTGSLRLAVATTGADLDPNGFALDVSGSAAIGGSFRQGVVVGANGSALMPAVPVGSHTIVLSDVAANCDVVGEPRQPVRIEPAKESNVSFSVQCAPAAQIAIERTSSTGQSGLYLINENGTGLRRITPEGSSNQDLAWSPDGARMAFTSDRDGNREIYVADADGSNPRRLTNEPADDYQPTWSPDGRKIAFVSLRAKAAGAEIFVMNDDGTNVVQLTSNDSRESDPAWSPDGTRIAFTNEHDGKTDVYVMNADGSSPTAITTTGGKQPAWSPDGTRLAFAAQTCDPFLYYGCYPGIWVKERDQSITVWKAVGERPTWSADGRKIAYAGQICDFYFTRCTQGGIRIAKLAAFEIIELADGLDPVWRP